MARNMNIIVVEDNPADADLIQEAFEETKLKADFNFISDGLFALDFLRQLGTGPQVRMPDLIILDLNLPKVGGKELLSEIKNNSVLKCIPVIMFSTSGAENDINQCYERGSNCYIIKPFDFEQFEKTIQMIKTFWFDIAKLPENEGENYAAPTD